MFCIKYYDCMIWYVKCCIYFYEIFFFCFLVLWMNFYYTHELLWLLLIFIVLMHSFRYICNSNKINSAFWFNNAINVVLRTWKDCFLIQNSPITKMFENPIKSVSFIKWTKPHFIHRKIAVGGGNSHIFIVSCFHSLL